MLGGLSESSRAPERPESLKALDWEEEMFDWDCQHVFLFIVHVTLL